jgi:hypothetical protein
MTRELTDGQDISPKILASLDVSKKDLSSESAPWQVSTSIGDFSGGSSLCGRRK